MTQHQVAGEQGLRRGAIGLREVLFQSITAMAPGAAIAASIPAGAAFAGGALPLSVIVAMVACLFAASSIGELARHLPAAGSVATYIGRGLHPTIGFLVAWGYVFVEALVPTLLLLQLGFTTASTLHSEWRSYPADLWWPWAILGAVIVGVVGYFGVRASAEMGTVLGAFEILVFLVLGVLFVFKAGSNNTLSVFGTRHTPAAHAGVAGVIAGSVYTVLAFSGFEAAAPLAEEAKDPRRTIRRAVLGATLGIGFIYIFTTYAADVWWVRTSSPVQHRGPDVMGRHRPRILRPVLGAGVLRDRQLHLANANAGANVSTRTAFALGRIGIFPRAFAPLHVQHRSPVRAVATQFVIAVAVRCSSASPTTPSRRSCWSRRSS